MERLQQIKEKETSRSPLFFRKQTWHEVMEKRKLLYSNLTCSTYIFEPITKHPIQNNKEKPQHWDPVYQSINVEPICFDQARNTFIKKCCSSQQTTSFQPGANLTLQALVKRVNQLRQEICLTIQTLKSYNDNSQCTKTLNSVSLPSDLYEPVEDDARDKQETLIKTEPLLSLLKKIRNLKNQHVLLITLQPEAIQLTLRHYQPLQTEDMVSHTLRNSVPSMHINSIISLLCHILTKRHCELSRKSIGDNPPVKPLTVMLKELSLVIEGLPNSSRAAPLLSRMELQLSAWMNQFILNSKPQSESAWTFPAQHLNLINSKHVSEFLTKMDLEKRLLTLLEDTTKLLRNDHFYKVVYHAVQFLSIHKALFVNVHNTTSRIIFLENQMAQLKINLEQNQELFNEISKRHAANIAKLCETGWNRNVL